MNEIDRLKAELANERILLNAIGELGLSLVQNEQLTKTGWFKIWNCNFTANGNNVTICGTDIRTVIETCLHIANGGEVH